MTRESILRTARNEFATDGRIGAATSARMEALGINVAGVERAYAGQA